MRFLITLLLLLNTLSIYAQDVDITELDQIFVDNINDIEFEEEQDLNTNIKWSKENTASTFISMKEKMKTNKGPILVFVIDGGDIYETENLVNFMNSKEGRSFRVYVNYMIVDSNDFTNNMHLKKRFSQGNIFIVNNRFNVMASGNIDFYKTKTGNDWWQAINQFFTQNPEPMKKAIHHLRSQTDSELIKSFDSALDKIKNASYRERKQATKQMKTLVKNVGFLLLPICANTDPEVSHTAKKLLMQTHTGVKFPLERTIPLWFNIDQQLAIFMQK
jgi:hypothetical protein